MGRTVFGAAVGLCVLAAGVAGCQKGPARPASEAAASGAPASSAAEVQPQLTPGTVSAVSGTTLTILNQGAPVSFQLSPATVIMIAHKGTVADIKAGDFLGTTNVPSADGTGQSTEVHIFPPGVKMGEGDRPMGTAPTGAATRMTNGTVSTAAPAEGGTRMTNGSVGTVAAGAQGVQMDVAYAGGHRAIVVPPNTSVMVMSSATPDQLKPGANVLVGAVPGPNGTRNATFINLQP